MAMAPIRDKSSNVSGTPILTVLYLLRRAAGDVNGFPPDTKTLNQCWFNFNVLCLLGHSDQSLSVAITVQSVMGTHNI